MNSKTLIGGLIGGVIGFLLGYLIYGLMLMDYFSSNMMHYEGLEKNPPDLWAIAIGNLCMGLLYAWIFSKSAINTAGKGIAAGIVISLLTGIGLDMFMYAQLNLFGLKLMAVDVLATLVIGIVMGAVLGWWFGRSPKPAAAA